jgi:hypothetical protein
MKGQQWVILLITIFVVVAAFSVKLEESWSDLTYVTCPLDGVSYRVRNLPDKERAAELLARTRSKLFTACELMKQRHGSNPRVQRMVERFKSTQLAEAEGSEKNTSYSINKGDKIVLCLRQKDGSNRMVDENLLLFVALHELSHIMTKSIGHTDEFWNNFRIVLETCQEAGLYKCQDFSANPQKYCGITVTNTPAPCFR